MKGLSWFIPEQRQHPPSLEAFAGSREDWWTWEQLSWSERTVGELGSVEAGLGVVADGAGELSFVVGREIRGEGSLEWHGPAGEQPDWSRIKVRPWYHAVFPDGSVWATPMGVFLTATPSATHDSGWVTVPVDLYDKTLLLARDRMDRVESLPAGTDAVAAIEAIVAASTGDPVNIDPGEHTLRSQMTWDQGTSRLRQVNDLLDAIGYFSLYADMMGAFTATRYVRTEDRPVVDRYVDGEGCTYADGFTITADDFDVPNKVIVNSRPEEGSDEVLTAVATVDEIFGTQHRLSFAQRGFWVVDPEVEEVDATDQDALEVIARRRLEAGLEVATSLPLDHFPSPASLNDVVRFSNGPGGVNFLGVRQGLQVPTTSGAWWTSTIRRIASEDLATTNGPQPVMFT
ncbi:hypothetical protein [Serinicoccus sediminis]|uniref:hypothetical protein n=1 Tax=Serinicoccus sediminis TaxID=2306021 RepID=UPI00101EAA43|nr:hypothetical protein [Serinicoccus sediminis]